MFGKPAARLYGALGVCAAVLLLAACTGESEEMIRRKLDVILDSDLAALVNDVPAASVADTTYWVVREYRKYSEGRFARQAVVDFFFLSGVRVKVERKYRYHRSYGKWERYSNTYRFADDSSTHAL